MFQVFKLLGAGPVTILFLAITSLLMVGEKTLLGAIVIAIAGLCGLLIHYRLHRSTHTDYRIGVRKHNDEARRKNFAMMLTDIGIVILICCTIILSILFVRG